MEKHFSIILLFLSLVCCQKNIDAGLVAYYPFNGDTKDHSGNNNHGVIDGATLTSDRFGKGKSACFFDGETSTILARVKNMPALDSPQSISWWFRIESEPSYRDELGADNMIALVDTSENIGIQFGFRAVGYQTLGFDTWNWGGSTLLEAEQPGLEKWHHCVYTYDTSRHRFFIDGIETANSNTQTQHGTPTLLMLGNYPSGNQYFAGLLDEIRIYHRTLEQEEILALLKEGK